MGKRPYFSLQNCPGDWDRISHIVTSIDLIAFPRTQCFCYKSPQNVDIVQQYWGSFWNFQDLQWERTSKRKIELFWVLSNQTTTNICDVFSSFVLWWRCWSQSRWFILTVLQWKHLSCEISLLSSFRVYQEHQSPCVHMNSLLFPLT